MKTKADNKYRELIQLFKEITNWHKAPVEYTVYLITALSVHEGKVRANTMDKNNSENFLKFLKKIYRKYPKKQLAEQIITYADTYHREQAKPIEWTYDEKRIYSSSIIQSLHYSEFCKCIKVLPCTIKRHTLFISVFKMFAFEQESVRF